MNLLFHFSEDPSIRVFQPRSIGGDEEGLVWAVDAAHAFLYYFPRQCPRVTFHAGPLTSAQDRARFFGLTSAPRVAAIEAGWLEAMRTARLYRYSFPDEGFDLQDEVAGYWVSRQRVRAVAVEPVGDLMQALLAEGVELRVMPSLWPLYDAVIASTLGFSIIRWRNASPRPGVGA